MSIKKRVTNVTRAQVAKLLLKNPDYTAKGLKKEVEKLLNRKYRYTERTYLNIKKELLANFRDDVKDKPWTIGSCIKCDIPANIIPLLSTIQGYATKYDKPLTSRTAQWIGKLYQLAMDTEEIQAIYNDNRIGFAVFVLRVAEQYAEKERVADMMEEPFPDTGDLDELYFRGGNADLLKGVLQVFDPEQYAKNKTAYENFKPVSKQSLELLYGNLSQSQVCAFNEYNKLQFLAGTEPAKSKLLEKKLLAEHPDIQPLIDSWNQSVLDQGLSAWIYSFKSIHKKDETK
jgi:hypothetical protein